MWNACCRRRGVFRLPDDRECLMGRLAGFRYREIVRRLKQLGFEFDRQAAGSHELVQSGNTSRYTLRPDL